MSQAQHLRDLATAMAELAASGRSTNADRLSRLDERRTATAALEDAWRSPVADGLRADIGTFLERCTATGQPFERGYGNLDELVADARRIAGQLEEAAGDELSWSQQVQELGRALVTGTTDVVSEMDLSARERAEEQYREAQRRHEAARDRREGLEQEWLRACATATTGIADAVRDLRDAEEQLRRALPDDDVDLRQVHGDVQLEWSRYAGVVLGAASASEQRRLWEGLDLTERSVLIERLPGLVRTELWHALSTTDRRLWESTNAYRMSSTISSLEWRVGFPVKKVLVGVGGEVQAERSDLSDGSVELHLEADVFLEAGVSVDFLEGFVGLQAGGWMTLRFDDAQEYETFQRELTEAVEQDLEGLEPDWIDLASVGLLGPVGGVANYAWRRRNDGQEAATVLDSANVVSAGVEVGAYRRLEAEIPGVVSAASRIEAGAFSDSITGESGIFLSGSLSGEFEAGTAGGGSAIAVDGRVYQTQDGRNYLEVQASGDVFSSSSLSGGIPGTDEWKSGVTAGTHTESSLTVEITADTTGHVGDLLAGVASGDTAQVAAAAAELADASHLTHTEYRSAAASTELKVGIDQVETSMTTTAGTMETTAHWEKSPYDQGYLR